MKATTITCDICGGSITKAVYTKPVILAYSTLDNPTFKNTVTKEDVCDPCAEKIAIFINSITTKS